MKQKQGQSVDSFMSNIHLALPNCQYGIASASEQLKNQFIFGVTIHDVQHNLLRTIKNDDRIKKYLHEARMVQSMIKQRKLLGIHRGSNSYDYVLQSCDHSKSCGNGNRRSQNQHKVNACKYCGTGHKPKQCPCLG